MASSQWNSQNEILHELLKKMRVDAGLTQTELANLLECPQSHVSKYENGERRLDITEIRNICICCGSSLKRFVNDLENILDKKA